MPQSLKAIFVVITFAALLCGQRFLAGITGHVTDQSGAAVSDAQVSIKSVETGQVTNVRTNGEGYYQALSLNPGTYDVIVEKEGFQRSVNQGVRLEIARNSELNVKVNVGDVQQTVEVVANAAVIQADSADQGLTIDNKRVENAPLAGRNIIEQAWSTPGVAVTASATRLRPFDNGGSSGMSINGGRKSGNELLLDGVSNINPSGIAIANIPPTDATEEFKVQTTNFDAQYGWTTGGVVNILTKGGSNEFHGNAYEFFQNTVLNANTFQSNRNGIARQQSHINTFGGNIGGPIKKNKLFFFFSYEQMRQSIPDPFTQSVPTDLQRQGNFSQTFDRNGNLIQIYNPFSTRSEGGRLVRDPFLCVGGAPSPVGPDNRQTVGTPCNIIPGSMINPVAAKVLGMIPGGNVPGDPLTGLNNFVNNNSSRPFKDIFPAYLGRVDYQLSESTKIFGRYSQNRLDETRGYIYSTTSALNPADTSGNSPFTRDNDSATFQLTHMVNPTTVLEVRAGMLRFVSTKGSPGSGYDISNLGFSPFYNSIASKDFPTFAFSNYNGAGARLFATEPASNVQSYQAVMSKNVSRHTVKFGGEFRLQNVNFKDPGSSAGNFSFDQLFTGADPLRASPSSGNSIASFLLGTPQSGYINLNNQPARQQRMISTFVQDDVRVNQRFTLNLGLRWDYMGPMTDRYDAMTRGFDRTTPSPLQVPGLDLRGGLLFVDGPYSPDRGGFYKHWNNFAPRVGMAYRLGDKTVLRAGYALIYGQTFNYNGGAPGYSQTTGMVTSIEAGVPYNTLTNPFPEGKLQPVGSSNGLLTNIGQSFNVADPNGSLPKVQQFSFQVQRELPWRMLAAVGYIHSRSSQLGVDQAINEISAADLAKGRSYLTANVPNPFAGLIPGSQLNGDTVQRQQLLRPFPQFLGITEQFRPIGKSTYNALQVLVSKRMESGLSLSVAYTFSKTLDQINFANAQDTQLEKVVSEWDVPHSFQINGVYELPFGRGKRFGSDLPSVLSYLASGWQVSALARIQSGMPMAFPSGAAPTGVSPALDNPNLDRWFNTCTQLADGSTRGCQSGDPIAWTIRQPFTLQQWSSRLDAVRLPPIRNLNASIMKYNRLTERMNLILRADFINATNTPQFFNGPNTDINSANFGRIAGYRDQSNLPRFVQLSMKLQF